MKTITLLAIFVIMAVGSVGTVGLEKSVPLANAKIVCNPSEYKCPPPGQSDFNNLGRCKQFVQDRGNDKDVSHQICKDFIKRQ